jgi:hypothetical protein
MVLKSIELILIDAREPEGLKVLPMRDREQEAYNAEVAPHWWFSYEVHEPRPPMGHLVRALALVHVEL